ncbi:TadE/TadG family type IV pilus assembly protein [Pararhizobium gei]|uniref:TadE/TadG family type IV pilus assembly protein n=1 Tax=Pararhizobium gei TaxID=1395951 RepID=UPI0023DC55EB|nr:VWA domain-containing protein [Rhizobium gei]
MQLLKRLISDRAGNFGIMAAIAVIPVLGGAGMAIDYSRAVELKSRLQDAADAAAVGALAEKSAGVAQAIAMPNDGPVPLSEEEALALFNAQRDSGSLDEIESEDPNMSVDSVEAIVRKKGRDINAEVSFKATMKTSFMRILGKDSITVSGKATATYQSQSYQDFYMLLDNTPSMGVAATPTDVANMIKATKNVKDSGSRDCAFACHIVSEKGVIDTTSNYFVARTKGITIRIDVVAKAVAALTETAGDQEAFTDQFRMAAYTFGETAMDVKLLKVAELTANLKEVKDKAQNIKLMSIPYQGYNNDQQTSFDDALQKMNAEIASVGDGATAKTPEKIVFFVSDGVGDSYKPQGCTKKTTGARCQEPIDTKFCEVLKKRNIKIAVLYTTYLPLPNNSWYNSWIKPFQSEIGTRMQECASPGFYFEVSPTEGIEQAMKELFNKVIRSPRLTG